MQILMDYEAINVAQTQIDSTNIHKLNKPKFLSKSENRLTQSLTNRVAISKR